MALALVFSSATIWSSECRTSSRLPSASSTTQTTSTLAMLTAAFRQKSCPLLLAARKLVGVFALFSFETHDAEHFLDLRLEMAQRALGHAQREGHILEDGQVGQQLEILEDHADLPPEVRQVAPLEPAQVLPLDVDAAGGRFLLADQEAHERGLPGAAGADEKDEILLGNFEADVAQRDRAVGIGLLHTLQADLRGGGDYRGHACLRWQQGRACRLGRDCCWHVNKSIPKAGVTARRAHSGRMTRAV